MGEVGGGVEGLNLRYYLFFYLVLFSMRDEATDCVRLHSPKFFPAPAGVWFSGIL